MKVSKASNSISEDLEIIKTEGTNKQTKKQTEGTMQLSFSSKHFAKHFHSVENSLKIKVQPVVSELIQT